MTETTGIAERVDVYEASIQLPTYLIKGENQNPVFRSQYGVAHIYPYSLLDDIDSKPTAKAYRTLVLENRYLRVTVIPDLGGRVYSVYDKLSEREVFYKNSIVKFSPLAIRGAFFSGGLEFSFPVAHAPTTADRVNWQIRKNEDGSASICLGGLEHISRLRWMITLTLFPDLCALAQDVTLFNPYSLPGRYHYWTNASLDADDQTEFIYPLRRVRSYEFAGTVSWPMSRLDLVLADPGLPGMEGVPMWPANRMATPFDFRWQKNMLAQVSIFGRDVEWDFFGAWQHSVDHGYAHFANHRDVGGMKLWSWGNAAVGVVNQAALTDDGSLYAETQCGAMETQLDFAFMPPLKSRAWREWWLPLRGLGGLTCASEQVGVRLNLAASDDETSLDLTLGICPARPLGTAQVEVSVLEKTLLKESVEISPAQPWIVTRSVPSAEIAGHPLRVKVIDNSGEVVLDYTLDRDPDPVQPIVTNPGRETFTAQDFYLQGLDHENYDNREKAILAYRRALDLDPMHPQVNFQLGLMLFRAGDLQEASACMEKSGMQGVVDATYYKALLALMTDQLSQAEALFLLVHPDSALYAASLLGLGSIAMRQAAWNKAAGYFMQARDLEDTSATGALMLSVALRLAGMHEEAIQELGEVLVKDPLNHAALHEMVLLSGGDGYRQALHRMLEDDRHYFLDLAGFYIAAGLPDEALRVLEAAYRTWEYPMVAYLAGSLCHQMGADEAARNWWQVASAANPALVFPSRLEEVQALRRALRHNPQDYRAKYYLGNFLYARQQFDEAVGFWQDALKDWDDFDVLYRNLGLAAWQREHNLPNAVQLFEKALSLNPLNQDLYLHLDELYKAMNQEESRRALLEKIDQLTDVREDLRKRSIFILVDLGEYEQALQIMQNEKFVPLEMDQSFHDLYVRALMQRAVGYMNMGRIEDAIQDYRAALEYPDNLGVGEPTTLSQADIHYSLGLAYESLGRFQYAIEAWRHAASEHHPHGTELYPYVQMALDKLSRYSELGFVI